MKEGEGCGGGLPEKGRMEHRDEDRAMVGESEGMARNVPEGSCLGGGLRMAGAKIVSQKKEKSPG